MQNNHTSNANPNRAATVHEQLKMIEINIDRIINQTKVLEHAGHKQKADIFLIQISKSRSHHKTPTLNSYLCIRIHMHLAISTVVYPAVIHFINLPLQPLSTSALIHLNSRLIQLFSASIVILIKSHLFQLSSSSVVINLNNHPS